MIAQLAQAVQQNAPQGQIFDEATLAAMGPNDIDEMSMATDTALGPRPMQGTDVSGQATPVVDTGVDNYTAGLEANQANPMSGVI